jgi:hypothetical protein
MITPPVMTAASFAPSQESGKENGAPGLKVRFND